MMGAVWTLGDPGEGIALPRAGKNKNEHELSKRKNDTSKNSTEAHGDLPSFGAHGR